MKFISYARQRAQEVIEGFHSSITQGLSLQLVEEQRELFGFNELSERETVWQDILLRQFKSPFIWLLAGACFLSYFLEGMLNAVIILSVIIINTCLGFYQEYGAYKVISFLKKLVVPFARVKRNGQETLIPSRELVPGDIVLLEAGDIVPADIRIVDSYDCMIDESLLTGETVPVSKNGEPLTDEVPTMYKAYNIGFAGTTIAAGKATGIVLATGQDTLFGSIAHLAFQTPRESVFEFDIRRFSLFILGLTFITLAVVILVHLLIKQGPLSLVEIILFSLALAIGITPEALPLVTTFALARGAHMLAQQEVIVKRLSAIDDLGSINVLCVDKTGTLTENKLSVSDVYGEKERVLMYGTLCSSFWMHKGQPVTNAIDQALMQALSPQAQQQAATYEKNHEVPFDAVRRRNSVVVRQEQGQYELIVRGAYDSVLPLCTGFDVQPAHEWAFEHGNYGNRVLAVAVCNVPYTEGIDTLPYEKNLKFIGLIALEDPIKPTAHAALTQAQELEVAVKIISGDAAEVVESVGHQVGLLQKTDKVLLGDYVEALLADNKEQELLACKAFARVSPQQKYLIIETLQKYAYKVGFVGDGVNDAPALKAAHVALAVQGACDIAREAADVILLKESLRVIVNGIKEGRKVFANTLKYVLVTLSANFGNFYAIAFVSLVIDFLPMLPLQILLLNLLSDFPMIMIATDSVDAKELRKPITFNIKDIAVIATILGLTSTLFDFIFFAFFVHRGAAVLQTMWFIISAWNEMAFIISVRTREVFYRASRPSLSLLILCGASAFLSCAIPFTHIGQTIFHFIEPQWSHLGIVFILVVLYFITTEIVKYMCYRFLYKDGGSR